MFAWVSNYLIRIGFSALLPPIIAELELSYTRAGLLAAGFFGAYAVVQLPAGILGDRLGRRRVLLGGLLAGAAASVSTGFAVSFATLLAARIVTGAAQGCLFSNDRSIIVAVTPPERLALGQAVSFAGPGLGITAGLLLGGLLGEWLPWRAVFHVFAAPPLVAALLIALVVPPSRPEAGPGSLGGRLRRLAREPVLWRLGLAGAAMMWVQYVLATWAPLLLREAGVAELGRAGLYTSFMGLAGVAGLLAGGWLADRARRTGLGRRAVVIACLVAATLTMLLLAVVVSGRPAAGAVAAAIFVVALCAWTVWGPSFALLGEQFAGRDLSTAYGLYNTVCVLGAVVGPGVTGWARDLTGSFAAGCYLSAAVALAGVAVALGIRPAAEAARQPAASKPWRL